MKKGVLLYLLIIFLTSCSSAYLSTLEIDQLHPAALSLPQTVKKVAVLDRMNVEGTFEKGSMTINSKYFAEYVGINLAESDYFEDVVLCDSNVSTLDRNDSIIMPLSQTNVRQLTEDLDVDMLVSVEHLSAKLVDMVFMPLIETKVVAKVYVPSRRTPIRNIVLSDTISWSSEAVSITYQQMQNDVMSYMAEKITHELVPYWQSTERYYYTGGNADFRDAETFLKKGDWDMATKIWSESLLSSKGSMRLQTLFNLAVSKEIMGDYEGASQACAELVSQSDKSAEVKSMALWYQEILNSRLSSQQLLHLQMQRFE